MRYPFNNTAKLSIDEAYRCARLLEITLPTTTDHLRSAFRTASRRHHPDTGGSSADFIRVKAAYDYLSTCGLPGVLTTDTVASVKCTVDGTPIAELGKGLGSTRNGVKCVSCNGRGYLSVSNPYYGLRTPILVLLASGITEYQRIGSELLLRYKCANCAGTGEREMFNPVFRKMTVVGGR